MNLFKQLKADRIAAMKNKDCIKKNLLGVLLGEASKNTKEPTDIDILNTIHKFIKQNKDTVECSHKFGKIPPTQFEVELYILESYLPRQLAMIELTELIQKFVTMSIVKPTLGQVMTFLKSFCAGRYDGKQAAVITTGVLNGI